jgi:hypothetical protein
MYLNISGRFFDGNQGVFGEHNFNGYTIFYKTGHYLNDLHFLEKT